MGYRRLTKEELNDYAPRAALKALERKLAARIKALEENQAQPEQPEQPAEPAVMAPAEPQPATLPVDGA